MNRIIIIADKVMPDAGLIGLIREHFPEQEIVVIRREDMGHDRGHPWGDPIGAWRQHSSRN
jgi:hypothetical protein